MTVLMAPDFRRDNPYQKLLADALAAEGVRVQFPVGYRRGLPLLRAVRSLSQKPDVLHLHWVSPYVRMDGLLPKGFYFAKLLADLAAVRASGTRLVWTNHNGISHDAPHPRLEQWFNRRLARMADHVIVHDSVARSHVIDSLGAAPDKVQVIPHGHFRDAYGPAVTAADARRALGIPATGRVYLNLGMLRPYKGLESLIDAWREGGELFAGSTLLLAGKPLDDAYGRHLQEMVKGVENVRLDLGFVPDDQIATYMCAADVVVLPFRQIWTSGSLILAMSYGKPVVAPRLGGLPETIGAADAFLYDPVTPDGLGLALGRTVSADLAEQRAVVAEACERLDWSIVGEATRKAYGIKKTMVTA